jgi:hypothetical protein
MSITPMTDSEIAALRRPVRRMSNRDIAQRSTIRPAPAVPPPATDGPTLEEMPCPHRGELLGKYDCGCSGKPDAYACSLPKNVSGLAIYPAKPLKKKTIIEKDGSKREFDGKPQSCSGCQWRLNVGWGTTRLPIDDGQLTAAGTARGIVTGAKAYHWPCLGALAIAAARRGVGLAVANHGLSDGQVDELNRVGVRWIDHDQPGLSPELRRMRVPSDAEAWWKPWVCGASPFDESLWIDSDAVLVDASEWPDSPSISSQQLWNLEPSSFYGRLARHYYDAPHCDDLIRRFCTANTGIVGFRRGCEIIRDWQRWAVRIMRNNAMVDLCNVRDQSAYVMMLIDRAMQGEPLPTLLDERWNVPADRLPAREASGRKPISMDPEKLLAQARERHEGAAVVHWLARPKPWELRDA